MGVSGTLRGYTELRWWREISWNNAFFSPSRGKLFVHFRDLCRKPPVICLRLSRIRDHLRSPDTVDSRNFLPKMRFLNILVVLRLDPDQISFDLVENAFATRQLALIATRIPFYDILARACAEVKILSFWTRRWPTSLGFSIFNFFPFPFSPFLLFCYNDRPSTGLACG